MEETEIIEKIFEILEDNKYVWTAKLCRTLNSVKKIKFCKFCRDYANPRKRAKQPHKIKSPCKLVRMGKLRDILYKLRDLGKIKSKRSYRLPDSYNNRGWDYYTIYFLPKNEIINLKLENFFNPLLRTLFSEIIHAHAFTLEEETELAVLVSNLDEEEAREYLTKLKGELESK